MIFFFYFHTRYVCVCVANPASQLPNENVYSIRAQILTRITCMILVLGKSALSVPDNVTRFSRVSGSTLAITLKSLMYVHSLFYIYIYIYIYTYTYTVYMSIYLFVYILYISPSITIFSIVVDKLQAENKNIFLNIATNIFCHHDYYYIFLICISYLLLSLLSAIFYRYW